MPIKPKIKANEAVRDVRSGMTDSQLMEKYGISAKGLQSLFQKLIEVKALTQAEMNQRRSNYHDTTVIADLDEDDIIADIRSGMSDAQLMGKYALSGEGLRRIIQRLMEMDAITVEELYGAAPSAHDTVFVENMRELPRHYLAIPLAIYESRRPKIPGLVNDVTEKGIAVAGIEAKVGETKAFVIPVESFIETASISFEAQCKWAAKQQDSGDWVAGFEITKISEKSLKDLRKLIESLPFLG